MAKINLEEYDFDLPMRLLARYPREELGETRDQARLLVMHRDTSRIDHVLFKDIECYFEPGDTLVLNDTKVIPAKLIGERSDGGKIEMVIFGGHDGDEWDCTIRPSRLVRPGMKIFFDEHRVVAEVLKSLPEKIWRVQFSYQGNFFEILDKIGELAVSMYTLPFKNRHSYNTVYANKPGSIEMPAAGRHFTSELLNHLRKKGVNIPTITLHIGLSALTVTEQHLKEERLGMEWCQLNEEVAQLINDTKKRGRKVVACGTTVTRTLETATGEDGITRAWDGWTELFVFPGYRWKVCDGIITNFHQPKSSRLLLAVAFAGWELVKKAYQEAISKEYLFYEFGDATLML